MAAFRVPLLLGLSTTVTLCTGAANSDDLRNFVEIVDMTFNSAVIMAQCPFPTQLLLACSLPLGIAFGVMTYRIGVGPAQKPNVASDSAACCCGSCCLFFCLLFPPIFAFYVGQGSTCDTHEDDAAFVDGGATFVFVGMFLTLLTYLVYNLVTETGRGAVASLHAKLKSCCACCGEPNDTGGANFVMAILVMTVYTILAVAGWSCLELLSASAQRVACLAEVFLGICALWVWWSRLYAKPTPPAVTEGGEPLLVNETPA